MGVLTLELFQQADGRLLANEMAPRVHNSGHWTQNGSMTSQFENHLRAVQGLPLGSTHAKALTCMINIIGKNGNYDDILKIEDSHLHLYGKSERAGRKLGHINLVADSIDDLKRKVDQVAQLLPDAPAPEFSF
ncbi:N5-carboxyaminoimidazole ribonucleotide synthase [Nitrincola nitratireducens]|uniref:N5-carboxyaminoimidazole ribonucleotide synthase n=1 Tax=Nitrincola nitratireducens TaxID=1229521 RepID=W9US06_9GAMM|nr:N5-carboxyaminoimidazole ribonucleotide synthase [Nitrincola nitratireducens]